MVLFEHKNIIRVSFEKENDLMIHEWFEYNPNGADDLILKILQEIYDAFLKYGATKVLVVVDKTKGAFSPDMMKYIEETQFPRLASETQLKYVATVLNREDMSSRYAAIWEGQLARNERFIINDVSTEQEGRDWLAQF